MVAKFERAMEEFKSFSKGCLHGPMTEVTAPWKPPSHGRIAINVDASIGNSLIAWAMVVRDHAGKVLFVASKWETGSSPLIAESKALVWAAKMAIGHGLKDVDWRSDAQSIIKQIVVGDDSSGWETRNEVLFLQHLNQNMKGWSFTWIPKSANLCADAAAKWPRHHKSNLLLSFNFSAFLPSNILAFVSGERSFNHSLE